MFLIMWNNIKVWKWLQIYHVMWLCILKGSSVDWAERSPFICEIKCKWIMRFLFVGLHIYGHIHQWKHIYEKHKLPAVIDWRQTELQNSVICWGLIAHTRKQATVQKRKSHAGTKRKFKMCTESGMKSFCSNWNEWGTQSKLQFQLYNLMKLL